jgi:hypothetical protein
MKTMRDVVNMIVEKSNAEAPQCRLARRQRKTVLEELMQVRSDSPISLRSPPSQRDHAKRSGAIGGGR